MTGLLATFEPPIRTLSLRQAHPHKDSATISIWDGGTLRVPFPSDIQRQAWCPKHAADLSSVVVLRQDKSLNQTK
ncbi:hypothetical protein TNCV_525031 [Trichonephila clavipes]|nr:hypothetical protein TNCV_525031 [Trichonephila clavipes]